MACSGTYRAYLDTISYALSASPDTELSLDHIIASPSDLLYVRYGERAQVVMALAFIEQGQHKWVSADNVVLTMEQGRLVRTQGLANDMLYLSNRVADPLKRLPAELFRAEWVRLVDWHAGEYGYQVRSEFKRLGEQQLLFFETRFNTVVFEEQVDYPNQSHFVVLNRQWRNIYWFDAVTGTLLQSQQQLMPESEPILMTYVSRISRLLEAQSL